MFQSDPQVMVEIQRAHHKEARDAAYTAHLARLARRPRFNLGVLAQALVDRLTEAVASRPDFRPTECVLVECA